MIPGKRHLSQPNPRLGLLRVPINHFHTHVA